MPFHLIHPALTCIQKAKSIYLNHLVLIPACVARARSAVALPAVELGSLRSLSWLTRLKNAG
jgi:hypothetical protein